MSCARGLIPTREQRAPRSKHLGFGSFCKADLPPGSPILDPLKLLGTLFLQGVSRSALKHFSLTPNEVAVHQRKLPLMGGRECVCTCLVVAIWSFQRELGQSMPGHLLIFLKLALEGCEKSVPKPRIKSIPQYCNSEELVPRYASKQNGAI